MGQLVADRRDIDFILYEVMQCQDLCRHEKYAAFNQKSFDMVISEARNFGIKEILPTYVEGDREGVKFRNGEVQVPECYRRPFELFAGEWTSMSEDPEVGGQGLPHIIAQAASEYLSGANISLTTYAIQGHGVGKMIELYGTEKQKSLFLKNLYTAHWTGAMLLTEPNAGSDVGALNTTAIKNTDGTYLLSGNKNFISVSEHDLTENIIHAVLARVKGAPKGIKGLSLFIVPKYWVEDDGSLSDRNGIFCTGIEEKMGIHGMVTCSFAMGDKGICRGLLLGEENMGMRLMFTMMNEERLVVGAEAFGHASMAYLYALEYAKSRLQGRDMAKGKDYGAPQVPIIQHPDVRRMLLEMKAYVEGMRSLIYYTAYCFDKVKCAENSEEMVSYNDMIDLLTPLVKAYCADRSYDVCTTAMQVFGGYGYVRDYPVEQLVRDVKVVSLFEGTNGIQAMDLVGRKIGMKEGKVLKQFFSEVRRIIDKAKETKDLEEMGLRVGAAINRMEEIAAQIGRCAKSHAFKEAFAFATPFLEVMGDIIMAWMLLWRATVAVSKLSQGTKPKTVSFYEGQINTAKYFIHNILPITIGKISAIEERNNVVLEISDKSFGG